MFDGSPEQPVALPPSPLEIEIAQEWQAAQLAQKHLGESLQRILDAARADRAEVARLSVECERLRKQLTLFGAELARLKAADCVGFDAPPKAA